MCWKYNSFPVPPVRYIAPCRFFQGIGCGLLTNSKSPNWVLLFVFSTSWVCTLLVYSFLRHFHFEVFLDKVVFPLVIHCRQLFISVAILSWTEVNFFKAWGFPVWYLLRVVLSESRYISTLGPSLNNYNSFPVLFIYSSFFYSSLRSNILLQNLIVSFASGWWRIFGHSLTSCR